jgi:hypothetical protein
MRISFKEHTLLQPKKATKIIGTHMIQKTLFYSSLACSHRSSELEDRLGLGPPHATTLASTSQSGCTIKQIWKSMR